MTPSSMTLCPHPPLLLRELCGRRDTVPELRTACASAVADLVAGADRVVVVGGADHRGLRRWESHLRLDVRRFGGPDDVTRSPLPLSVGVGLRLLDEAGWGGDTEPVTLPWDATDQEVAELAAELVDRDRPADPVDPAEPEPRVAVLLLGEGSARRGEKAPGYLDDRAFAFDDAVATALGDGDGAALRSLDAGLAEDLMVSGAAVLRLLGTLVERPAEAVLTHRADPYGVSYFVATWR